MPTNLLTDTDSGSFADQPGSNQIVFGSAPATLTAGQGQDTVQAGSGPLFIDASGDSNAISVTGGAGTLVYAAGPSSGATISAGSGAITILPGDGPVAVTAGGGTIDIYSAATWSGYYQLTPSPGDELSIAYDASTGYVDVTESLENQTLVIGEAFAFFQSDPSTPYMLVQPPTTVAGFTTATQPAGAAGDLTTADPDPVLTGSAPPNSVVTITDASGDAVGQPASADAEGLWQIALGQLPYGETELAATASVIVGGGAIEPSAAVSVEILPPAPVVAGFDDASGSYEGAGQTSDRQPQIVGSTQAGSTVEVFADGALLGQAVVAGSTWTFDPTSPLPEGDLTITAIATDAASGVASEASAPLSLEVVLAPPAIDGFQDDIGFMAGGDTLDHRPVLSGTAPAGSVVSLYDDGALIGASSATGGIWSFTPAAVLQDGAHEFTAVATDPITDAVSTASSPLDLTIDPSAPFLDAITGVSGDYGSGAFVPDGTLTLSGTADPGTTVTVTDEGSPLGQVVASGGAWTFTLPATLMDGPHDLAATAADPSDGDVSQGSNDFAFVLTRPAPVIAALAAATGGATTETNPAITGTAVAGDEVSAYDGAILLGSATADASGAWQITPSSPLGYGSHILTAYDTAADGETVSPASAPVAVDIVPTAPVITSLDGDGDGAGQPLPSAVTADAQPTLSGTAPPGFEVAVYDGSSLVAQSDLVGAGGRWSVQLPDALAAGLHDLTARTLDVSGAVSAPSAALSLVINPPPLASPAAGEDPLAASIRSGISDLLSGGLVYAEAGQPEGSGAAGAAPALSIDDSTTDQLIQVPTGCAYVSDIASGPVTVFGADGGAPQAVSASGQIYYVAGEGSTVLLADQSIGGDVVFGSTSASSDLEAATGAGDDILVARSSDVSLSGGSGANQFWLGSGQADVDSDGADTIVAGSGAATVTGGADTISAADGHSDLVFGGSGTLWFSNLAGGSTVVGGAGSDTLFGGSGPTCFYGGSGGGNILIGGSGPSTLVGGGDGDLLYARGSGNDVLAAGGDNATLAGGSSTGNNLYFGGSGRNVIAAGAGADTIAGGSGQSTIFAGAGDDLVFGAAGGGVIVAGSGNATLVGGAGPELYAVFDGRAGGDVTIDGFRPGVDHLTLPDYSAQSVAASLLGQIDQAGSTQLLLSDGTTITFSGLSGLQASSLV